MNSSSKYIRGKAKWISCRDANPCAEYISRNSTSNLFISPDFGLNVVGVDSATKTLTLFSNTLNVQLFTATWSVGANLLTDAPISNTDWDSFAVSYVSSPDDNYEISIDLQQWAIDNGAVNADVFSYTFSSSASNGDCSTVLVSDTISETIVVIDPCISFEANNDVVIATVEPLRINVTSTNATTKTVTLFSDTFNFQIFTATWNISDDLYLDNPISNVGWGAFKAAYVDSASGGNTLVIDYNSFSLDSGGVHSDSQDFTASARLSNSECDLPLVAKTYKHIIQGVLPSVPQNLTVVAGDEEVTASWDAAANATSYVLEYKLDSDATYTTQVTTSIIESVKFLINNSVYNFRIKSRNVAGDSAYSSIVNATPVSSYIPKTYVIIASGESTVVGRSNDKTTPPDTTDSRITQWGRISPNDGVEILADDPLQHNDTAQASNSIGMTMSYARALLPTLNAADKIIIVPVARGGSGYYNNEHGIGNVLFTDTVARVNAVIALDPSNTILKMITGIGVNDGFYNASSTFQASFDADDANYRAAFTGNQSEMIHLVMGIIPAAIALGNEIPQAQAILQDSGNRLFNTTYVQWDDGLPISGSDSHPNGASNRTMGARLQTFDAAFTPVTPYAPATAPTGLTVTDGAEALTVSFDDVDFANSYVVQYKLSTDTVYTDIVTTSTSIVVSSLTASVSYDVRVKARNLIGDSSASTIVTGTPTAASSVREVGADIHHFFGTDYSTFEDIQGGGALTLAGSAPSNGSGTTGTGVTNSVTAQGLLSNIDQDSAAQTVIAVVKLVNNSSGAMLLGNVKTSGTAGGFSIFEIGDAISCFNRGTSGNTVFKAVTDYNEYVFVATSMGGSNHLGYYNDSLGGKSVASYTGSIDSSTGKVGVGNTSYLNTSFGNGLNIAEFIIFDSAKTEAELDAIYARSIIRMNARGINVGTTSAPPPLPSVPTGLNVDGVLFGANATWNASTNAASYVLNYTLNDGTGTPTEVVVSPTSHDVVGTLLNADNYDFQVKARNVTGDSAYSAVITIKPFNFRESGAECHHVLGDDNTTYSDIDGTHTLTKVGTGHTESVGFASTLKTGVSSYMNGLLSNTADLSNNQTMIIVGKLYSDVNGAMLLGNLTTSGTAGGSGVFEQHSAGADFKKLFVQNRGTGAFHYVTRPPDDTWFMVAVSFSGTNRKTFYQDPTMSSPLIIDQGGVSVTTSTPARNIGFGNTSYNQINKRRGMHIAEGIIINAGKTDAELSAIYARSVARLGLRGVTL